MSDQDMTDYEDIVNRSWDDIPEPQTLPVGTYLLRAHNASYVKAKKADQNDRIMFVYKPVEAQDDVDPGELEALGENFDISGEKIFFPIWLEGSRDWDGARRHLRLHDIEPTGRKVGESLKEVGGQDLFAYVGERTYTNSQGVVVTDNTASNFQAVGD